MKDRRDRIANFDDFFRPIRSYFYWELHCSDTPACWALSSVFDLQDGVDQLSEKFEELTASPGCGPAQIMDKMVVFIP